MTSRMGEALDGKEDETMSKSVLFNLVVLALASGWLTAELVRKLVWKLSHEELRLVAKTVRQFKRNVAYARGQQPQTDPETGAQAAPAESLVGTYRHRVQTIRDDAFQQASTRLAQEYLDWMRAGRGGQVIDGSFIEMGDDDDDGL
jgi:hypothetical protein